MDNHYHLNKVYIQKPLEYEEVYVAQIGRLYCKSTTVIDSHIHTNLFEVTIVTDGVGIITTNGVSVKVSKGDIYLSHPCDIHKIETDPENLLKYDFFAFSLKDSEFKDEFEKIAGNCHSPYDRIFRDEHIRPLISNAIAELNSENTHSKQLLTALFKQILIYIIRGFEKTPLEKKSNNVSHADIICYKLMNYIDTHIYSIKNLNELSSITDYSYGYLSTLFKKTTNNNLSEYFYKRKLDAARLLILENKLTITEISELLNYSSMYAFSKAFSKQYGLSPRIYRNKELSQKEKV